jgi:hypothetical protein
MGLVSVCCGRTPMPFRTVHHLVQSLWHSACRRDAEGQIQQRLTGKKATTRCNKCTFRTEVANLTFRQHERVVVEHRPERNRDAVCGAALWICALAGHLVLL